MFYKFRISLLQPIDKNRLIADAAALSGAFFFEADSRISALVAVHDWLLSEAAQ